MAQDDILDAHPQLPVDSWLRLAKAACRGLQAGTVCCIKTYLHMSSAAFKAQMQTASRGCISCTALQRGEQVVLTHHKLLLAFLAGGVWRGVAR